MDLVSSNVTSKTDREIKFRAAKPQDGLSVWRLVQRAGTLEVNTAYFYALFCSDFRDTCLVALQGDDLVGVVLGYRRPSQRDTLFCWQIAVTPSRRAQGLASQMLRAWLALPGHHDVRWVAATVATDNVASDRLFRRLATDLGVSCDVSEFLSQSLLPQGHPPEPLYRVGPISPA